jgi:peptidoglycan/LPS O-acetylase OafA/YrhL
LQTCEHFPRNDAGNTSATRKSAVQYRPAIDGLRAIAVLGVFIFHLNRPWLPGGFVGVDVFFVISGFLITTILLRDYEAKTFSLWRFYQRRIARLFPAFFAVALATIVAAMFLYSAQDFASSGTGLYTATLSVANIKYMAQGNYFAISPDAQPFLHCWSLSVEEQFYLLFPTLLLVLYLKANRHKFRVLVVLCGASLTTCIALTYRKPEWAFYLLPTRAWELMAGSILATLDPPALSVGKKKLLGTSLSIAGLLLIVVSFFLIKEGSRFPGYHAIPPVLGAVCILGSGACASRWTERLLSTGPIALTGRMSYSLYLWHWPIFSFVDYKLYLASPLVRIALKVLLSAVASSLCFFLIEGPGRVHLNDPHRRTLAFGLLAGALVVLVPLGLAIRTANYIDARPKDVAQEGISFNQSSKNGSIVLMGNSNGSMYGKIAKEISRTLHLRLNVISVSAGNPLPASSGGRSQLWLDSLAFVKRENPGVVIFGCNWSGMVHDGNLEAAINELLQHTRRLILITQPPQLPKSADRESMRQGSRPPFLEDAAERTKRMATNSFIKQLHYDHAIVLDIEPLFTTTDGSIRFVGDDRSLLFQDRNHLSYAGTELVKPDMIRAVEMTAGRASLSTLQVR